MFLSQSYLKYTAVLLEKAARGSVGLLATEGCRKLFMYSQLLASWSPRVRCIYSNIWNTWEQRRKMKYKCVVLTKNVHNINFWTFYCILPIGIEEIWRSRRQNGTRPAFQAISKIRWMFMIYAFLSRGSESSDSCCGRDDQLYSLTMALRWRYCGQKNEQRRTDQN